MTQTRENLATRPDRATDTIRATAGTTSAVGPRNALYSSLIGLASIVVLLQGLWAGLFVHEGQDYQASWVEVHARGADVAILLTLAAMAVAFLKLRSRRDLLIGTAAFAALLMLEAYLGGEIGASPVLTAVHFPLGMALMGLSVWLPFRATRR